MRRVVHLVPHTHWDREWYRPLGAFRARLVGLVDRLTELLESDPRVRSFLLDGQTVLLEDYLALRPERQPRVEQLLRAGRLVTGPWYVLADEQIPTGEALLRNLSAGREDLRRWGAESSGVLYSPDAFGHPAALPGIAAEFGLEAGLAWRGIAPERLGGQSLFRWEGAGPSPSLLTAFLPAEGYSLGAELLASEVELASRWAAVSRRLLPRQAPLHVLLLVGADHHEADPALGSLAERLSAIEPAVEFRFSSLREYFAAVAGVEPLATLTGELRESAGHTWALPGVASTRLPFKRRVGEVELLLTRHAEPIVALGGDPGGSSRAVLAGAWREVIQSQFHDVLCGCCADEVTRAAESRIANARAAAEEVIEAGLDRLAGHDPDRARGGAATEPRLLVWNPVPRPRGGVVTAEVTFFTRDVPVGPPDGRPRRRGRGMSPFHLRLAVPGRPAAAIAPQLLGFGAGLERLDARRHYPDQDKVERARIAFPLPAALDGLSLTHLTIGQGAAALEEPFAAARGRRLWNGRIDAALDARGAVALGRVGAGPLFRDLLTMEVERDLGDSYTFCPARGGTIRVLRPSGRPRVPAAGPYVASLGWSVAMTAGARRGTGRVYASLELSIRGDEPFLRCEGRIDNQASDHRLRLRFPLGIRRAAVRAGAQFGWVERPAGPRRARSPIESPAATAPAHRWVAVARGDRGLALLLPGFFEYEWTAKGDLLLTLLRSVGELSREGLRTRPGHAGWPTPTPEAQCPGLHTVTLAIAPVAEADVSSPDRLERIWEEAFLPLGTRWIRQFAAVPDASRVPAGGWQLEGDGLVFSAAQPVASGLRLRCFNALERSVAGAWRLPRAPASAQVVRADGTVLEVLAAAHLRDPVPITVPARAMHTLQVNFDT